MLELGGQVVDLGGGAVVCLADAAGSVGLRRLGVSDLAGGERAALGDLAGLTVATLGDGERGGGDGARLGRGDVEDIEGAAGCGLLGEGLGGVMRDLVAVHDVLLKEED